jgi:hypothetical protein
MSGVLRGIAGLSLLAGIVDAVAAFPGLMRITGLRVTGTFVTLIVWRHGRGLRHRGLRLLFVLRRKTTRDE